jgi:hypothetical protein
LLSLRITQGWITKGLRQPCLKLLVFLFAKASLAPTIAAIL